MEGPEDISKEPPRCEEEVETHPEPTSLQELRSIRGFRRKMPESMREVPGEGLSRLARLGNGLRRRLSGSTRDVFVATPEGVCEVRGSGSGLRRHLSASMKDLLLSSMAVRSDGQEGEGLGRRLSRRLSLLAGSVAIRADHSRGSLRARFPNLRRTRTFTVTVILPDSSVITVVGDGTHTVGQALRTTAQDHCMTTFSLALADSHAEVDLEAPAHLLDGDIILLQDASDSPDLSNESDARLRVANVLATTERTMGRRLRCVDEVYGQHLRRLSSVSHYEHQLLFDSVQPIIALSDQLVESLDAAVASWDPENTCLGSLFEEEVWERYEEYLDLYEEAVKVLREKEAGDEEFVALCRLRRGAARHSLVHLLHLPMEQTSPHTSKKTSLQL